MHILLIHQAFTDLDEAGGTRHTELVNYLAGQGHRVTVIASPVSYLSGKAVGKQKFAAKTEPAPNLTIYRCYTYTALHRSFVHRILQFPEFHGFIIFYELAGQKRGCRLGHFAAHFSRCHCLAGRTLKARPLPVRSPRSVAGLRDCSGVLEKQDADPDV